MTKPILALDVDGPIALMGTTLETDTFEVVLDSVPLRISRALPARLAQLVPVFQIVWSSSWGKRASYKLAPLLGLPSGLPYIRFPPNRRGSSLKLAGLSAFLGSHPAAIVDDEIGNDLVQWAEMRHSPTLVLHIDAREGLQDAHVLQLLAFAQYA